MSKKVTTVKPLGDKVFIKYSSSNKETKTDSGIIIPETVSGDDRGAKRGEIIAIGEGKYVDGKLVPLSVKVGQTVLFTWGDDVIIDGEEYHLVSESNILGIIN